MCEPIFGWQGGTANRSGWLDSGELLTVMFSSAQPECLCLLLSIPNCGTQRRKTTHYKNNLDHFTQWVNQRTKFKPQAYDARMNLFCKPPINSFCMCVLDLGNRFSNNRTNSAKISKLTKINHCNYIFFPLYWVALTVDSGIIIVPAQKKRIKSIAQAKLWKFKLKSATLIWLVPTIYWRHSLNSCKSFCCGVYILMS